MNFATLVPAWLDALLIAPFRLPDSALIGFWLGCTTLAVLCLITGELTSALLFLLHHKRFTTMQDEVLRYHNLSVDALHSGNKEAYLATNKMAHERFGQSFFALGTLGLASIWPLPFALAWLSLRFEGVEILAVPGTSLHLGYVFVLLVCYIAVRLLFGRCRRFLPFFAHVEALRYAARQRRGEARQF